MYQREQGYQPPVVYGAGQHQRHVRPGQESQPAHRKEKERPDYRKQIEDMRRKREDAQKDEKALDELLEEAHDIIEGGPNVADDFKEASGQ